MADNYIYYGIIVYVIMIAVLILTKPSLIYNHKDNKYREFGWNFNDIRNPTEKTPLSLGTLSVVLAILIGLAFGLHQRRMKKMNNGKITKKPKIKYVAAFPQMMQGAPMMMRGLQGQGPIMMQGLQGQEPMMMQGPNLPNPPNVANGGAQGTMGQIVHMMMPQVQYVPVMMECGSEAG